MFKTNQPKLHKAVDDASRKLIADIVRENFVLNKQAYDELEHYKKTQSVLGAHPIFEQLRLQDEIRALSTPKLFKKIKALEANISRNKQKGNDKLVARDEPLLVLAKQIAEKR